MIVRNYKDASESDRKVTSPDSNWQSVRMLLKEDDMGFSFHITTIFEGADFRMHYKHHLESVYCISGEGEIESLENGKKWPIGPGTLYILDKHDRHILRAFTEMQMACVFNPPLRGDEVHDRDGSYELRESIAS